MAWTETLTQRQAFAGNAPQTLNNSTITTGNGINMSIMRRIRFFLNVGAVTSSGSVTLTLKGASSSGGSFSNLTTLTSYTFTTTTANQCNSIEVRSDQLPAGLNWIQASVTETASQNVVVDLFAIADESEYKPASSSTPSLSTYTFTNQLVN